MSDDLDLEALEAELAALEAEEASAEADDLADDDVEPEVDALTPAEQLAAYREAGIPDASLVVVTYLDGSLKSVTPIWED